MEESNGDAPIDEPTSFAPGESERPPLEAKHLPHLAGLPTIFTYQDIQAGSTSFHIGMANCAHNSDPMPGLATFLRQATSLMGAPPSASLVSAEVCPDLAEAFGIAADENPDIMLDYFHTIKHLLGAINRFSTLLYVAMMRALGEREAAATAFVPVIKESPAPPEGLRKERYTAYLGVLKALAALTPECEVPADGGHLLKLLEPLPEDNAADS